MDRAPLARVLAQMRFEPLGVFSVRENPILRFVDQLLDEFPLYEEGFETEITVGPEGVRQNPSQQKIWRLKNTDSSQVVSVANGSLALETTSYSSRTDFVQTFTRIVEAFHEFVGKSPIVRLGIRYTNRVEVPEGRTEWLKSILKPEVYGGLAVNLDGGARLQHSLSDWSFLLDSSTVQARSGLLPENAIFDPSLPPLLGRHWFLDIDSYREDRKVRSSGEIASEADSLATNAYNLFRWMVTDEFVREFGGTV